MLMGLACFGRPSPNICEQTATDFAGQSRTRLQYCLQNRLFSATIATEPIAIECREHICFARRVHHFQRNRNASEQRHIRRCSFIHSSSSALSAVLHFKSSHVSRETSRIITIEQPLHVGSRTPHKKNFYSTLRVNICRNVRPGLSPASASRLRGEVPQTGLSCHTPSLIPSARSGKSGWLAAWAPCIVDRQPHRRFVICRSESTGARKQKTTGDWYPPEAWSDSEALSEVSFTRQFWERIAAFFERRQQLGLFQLRVLDRYLLEELLLPLLCGVATFTTLGVSIGGISDVAGLLHHAAPGRFPGLAVSAALLLRIPHYVGMALPMASLLASMLGLGRLGKESEIVALRGAGVTKRRLVLPVAVFFAIMTALHLLLSEGVVPLANRKAFKIIRCTTAMSASKADFVQVSRKGVKIQSEPMQPVIYPEFRKPQKAKSTANHGVIVNGLIQLDLERLFYAKHFDGDIMHGVALVEMKVYYKTPFESVAVDECVPSRLGLLDGDGDEFDGGSISPPLKEEGSAEEANQRIEKVAISKRQQVHLPSRVIMANEGKWDQDKNEWLFLHGTEYLFDPSWKEENAAGGTVKLGVETAVATGARREPIFDGNNISDLEQQQSQTNSDKPSFSAASPSSSSRWTSASCSLSSAGKVLQRANGVLDSTAMGLFAIRGVRHFEHTRVAEIGRTPFDLAKAQRRGQRFDDMTLPEILAWKRLLQKSCSDTKASRRIQVKMHQRLALPFACLIFGVLGSLISLIIPKDQQKIGLICTLTTVFIYYVLSMTGSVQSQLGLLPPILGSWLPNIVGIVLALFLLFTAC